jgi:isopenicillin N synthase-like dioxygenase
MSDFSHVPVVDIAGLSGADPATRRAIAARMRSAAIDVGFFYVRGHGVSSDLVRATRDAAKAFFARDEAAKRRIVINAAHRGYVPFAQTTLSGSSRTDLKESFNFAYPFAADDPEVLARRPLIGVNQWPAGDPAWRAVVESYYAAVFEVGQRILEGLAIALALSLTFFRERYRRPLVRTRLLHYPPQPTDSSGSDGAAEHTDYGCITVLWQDDVGGLQVRNRAGDWIDAPPIPDSFVVNIGDMLARWSNDLFVSTPHRVRNASGRERYSIATFCDPDFDTRVECLPNCAGPGNPPKYEPIVAGEYITAKYDASYAYRQRKGAAGLGVAGANLADTIGTSEGATFPR